jgi:DNA-binding SARP family transcriptional activator
MATVNITMFGRFRVQCAGRVLAGFELSKAQELFSYLVLYRNRQHSREVLASLLWGDCAPAVAKKYLRQTLWQIQTTLETAGAAAVGRVLSIETDWVQVKDDNNIYVDVDAFEEALCKTRDTPGASLTAEQCELLRSAVDLYQGDLLESCYQDWCLFERERLQSIYLMMLDKLSAYYEAHHQYEAGLDYGIRILRYDRARERTHRRLMRIYALAGDRTAALRQYEQCMAALREELDVEPAKRTVDLYEQIRRRDSRPPADPPPATLGLPIPPGLESLSRLKRLNTAISKLQRELEHEIQRIEHLPGWG